MTRSISLASLLGMVALLLCPFPATAEEVATTAPVVRPLELPEDVPEVRPHTLVLTILDKDTGLPIPAVKVRYIGRLHSIGGNGGELFGDRGVINSRGEYSFFLPTNKLEHLGAAIRIPGYVPMGVGWSGVVPAESTLNMEPGTTIGGKVVDDAGRPVAGAKVHLNVSRECGQPHAGFDISGDYVKTDDDGAWTYDRAPGGFKSAQVGADDSRYITHGSVEMVNVTPDDAVHHKIVLTLHSGLTLNGTVVDTAGQPVEGAAVSVSPDTVGSGFESAFKTGPKGEFQITIDRSQKPTVNIMKEDYASQQIDLAKIEDAAKPLLVTLQPRRTLQP